MATTPESVRLWGGEVFLFPNFFFLPQFSNSLSYRIRPYNDDPEWCRFEVWSLTMPPDGEEPGRARLQGRYPPDDADNWGLIPRQDFSNMAAPAARAAFAGASANTAWRQSGSGPSATCTRSWTATSPGRALRTHSQTTG